MTATATRPKHADPRWKLDNDTEYAALLQRCGALNARLVELQQQLDAEPEFNADINTLADKIVAGDEIDLSDRRNEIRRKIEIVKKALDEIQPKPYSDGAVKREALRNQAETRIRRMARPEREQILKRMRAAAGDFLQAMRDEMEFCNELERGQLSPTGHPFEFAGFVVGGVSREIMIAKLQEWCDLYDKNKFSTGD